MSDSILHPNTERLQGLVEGNLDEAEQAVIESHLLGCATCQSEVDEWRVLFNVLATLPQFTPSVHFADNIMAQVKLPDPWYVRALVRAGDRIHKYAPKTTRGWGLVTACLALPFVLFALVATWVLSKPYITPTNVFAYFSHRGELIVQSMLESLKAQLLQTEAALFIAQQLQVLSEAGAGAAGALLAAVAIATAASAYILYQNLFRADAQREQRYVTFSF